MRNKKDIETLLLIYNLLINDKTPSKELMGEFKNIIVESVEKYKNNLARQKVRYAEKYREERGHKERKTLDLSVLENLDTEDMGI